MSYGARSGHGYGNQRHRNTGIRLWDKKIPDKITDRLLSAKTASEASNLVSKNEKAIADFVDKHKEGYLDCDEAASVLSQVLDEKGIAHEWINGVSNEGSAHAYLKVVEDGKDVFLDPTDQLPPKMNAREAKQFLKWGVVFPKGVPTPINSSTKGYIVCPECGQDFEKNRANKYVAHFQNEHPS